MSKLKLEVEGLDTIIERLKSLDANIQEVAEEALKATHDIVTEKARAAIKPRHQTGKTESSIYETTKVRWTGTVGEISTGFNISKGGLPSIFLMYGTPRHKGANQYGPHGKSVEGISKDKALYSAFFGNKTRNEIIEKQSEIFYDAIRKADG